MRIAIREAAVRIRNLNSEAVELFAGGKCTCRARRGGAGRGVRRRGACASDRVVLADTNRNNFGLKSRLCSATAALLVLHHTTTGEY